MSDNKWENVKDPPKCDKTVDRGHKYAEVGGCRSMDCVFSWVQCQACMLVCVMSAYLEPLPKRFYTVDRLLEINEQLPGWVLYGRDPPTY